MVKGQYSLNNVFIEDLKINADKTEIQKKVVGAVVVYKDGVLILRRKANDFMGRLFELPSGGLEANEDIITGLKREILEETGLEVKKITSYLGHFDYESNSGKKVRQFNFMVTAPSKNIILAPDEHDLFCIVSPDSAKFNSMNISAETKKIIISAWAMHKNSFQ